VIPQISVSNSENGDYLISALGRPQRQQAAGETHCDICTNKQTTGGEVSEAVEMEIYILVPLEDIPDC